MAKQSLWLYLRIEYVLAWNYWLFCLMASLGFILKTFDIISHIILMRHSRHNCQLFLMTKFIRTVVYGLFSGLILYLLFHIYYEPSAREQHEIHSICYGFIFGYVLNLGCDIIYNL